MATGGLAPLPGCDHDERFSRWSARTPTTGYFLCNPSGCDPIIISHFRWSARTPTTGYFLATPPGCDPIVSHFRWSARTPTTGYFLATLRVVEAWQMLNEGCSITQLHNLTGGE